VNLIQSRDLNCECEVQRKLLKAIRVIIVAIANNLVCSSTLIFWSILMDALFCVFCRRALVSEREGASSTSYSNLLRGKKS